MSQKLWIASDESEIDEIKAFADIHAVGFLMPF